MKIRREEHEYMNIHPPLINALVTALHIHVSCLLDLCSIFCVDVAVNIAENWTVQRQQNYSTKLLCIIYSVPRHA